MFDNNLGWFDPENLVQSLFSFVLGWIILIIVFSVVGFIGLAFLLFYIFTSPTIQHWLGY